MAMQLLVILLVALPAAAAIVAAALGPGRAALIRKVCLAVTIADAFIAISLAIAFCANNTKALWPGEKGHEKVLVLWKGQSETLTTFRPDFVPGASSDDPHATT